MTLDLSRAAETFEPGAENIYYSGAGYVLTADGRTHVLLRRHWHGVVLALLFPEALARFRFDGERGDDKSFLPDVGKQITLPDTVGEVNTMYFQQFELRMSRELNTIRVCPMRLVGAPSIDLPRCAATTLQITALITVMNLMGLKPTSEVETDLRTVTRNRLLQWAAVDIEERK